MNCWEFTGCRREKGGVRASRLGICPAALRGAGEACWLVAGTFCGGRVQGDHAQKLRSCLLCAFYNHFDQDHRVAMRRIFGATDEAHRSASSAPGGGDRPRRDDEAE